MTRRKLLLTTARGFVVVALAASFAGHGLALADGLDEEQAELANSLSSAKVSLQQGMMASEREGQPISGKFEVDNGKLQLSVYTAKEGNSFEVIVDHMTRLSPRSSRLPKAKTSRMPSRRRPRWTRQRSSWQMRRPRQRGRQGKLSW